MAFAAEILAALLVAVPAAAQPSEPAPATSQEPLPGQADGRALDEEEGEALLWVPRILLALPRLVFLGLTEPIYGLAVLEDRHELRRRITDVFFNDERTFGVFPTAFVETGFGASVGARLIHNDLFGRDEHLRVRAGFGGLHQQRHDVRIDTGTRLGDGLEAQLHIGYESRDSTLFAGIGNPERISSNDVTAPLDPADGSIATDSRYRSELAEARLIVARTAGHTSLLLTHAWRLRHFDEGPPESASTPWVSEVYDSSALVGYDAHIVDAYTEVRLHWDNREIRAVALPPALPSAGFRIDAWGGWHVGVDDGEPFGRLGLDVQPFLDLFGGDRILKLRLRLEAVAGGRERIPFADLPSLGGSLLLRGYPGGRFRDRLAVLTSVEYRYPIQPMLGAYLFVDAGRVYGGLEEVTLEGLRVGFGGGLILFTSSDFLFAVQIASSIEGGLVFNLALTASDDLGRTY